MCAANRNVRTKEFKEQYDRLPARIRELADRAFALFRENPNHPSLELHNLHDTARGSHRRNSVAVSITRQYRAIFAQDDGDNVWYWIGTHSDYNGFTGRSS